MMEYIFFLALSQKENVRYGRNTIDLGCALC